MTSRHKQTARLLARAEQRYRDDMWRVTPASTAFQRACDAVGREVDAYMKRPCNPAHASGLTALQEVNAKRTPEFLAECNADWNAIPNTPAEIAVWMRGEPLGARATPMRDAVRGDG